MDRHEMTASILEKDKTAVVSRGDKQDPKPLDEVIQSAASAIASIFEKHPGGIQAAQKGK